MTETGEQWSTKSQSTLSGQLQPATLNLDQTEPEAAMVPAALTATAVELLKQASESNNALLRANAIEGMHYAPEQLDPLVARGLVDHNRGVRFVAAMTIGEFRLDHLAHLLEPLLADPSDSVRAAAIYGLKSCGKPVDPSPLAAMIVSDDTSQP